MYIDLGKESTDEDAENPTWSEVLLFFPKLVATATPTCEFRGEDNTSGGKYWHKKLTLEGDWK